MAVIYDKTYRPIQLNVDADLLGRLDEYRSIGVDAAFPAHPRRAGTIRGASAQKRGEEVSVDDPSEVRPMMTFRQWWNRRKKEEEDETGH